MSVTLTLTDKQIGALRKVVQSHHDAADSEEVEALRKLIGDVGDSGNADRAEATTTQTEEQAVEPSVRDRRSVAELLADIDRRRAQITLPPDYPGTLELLREDRAR